MTDKKRITVTCEECRKKQRVYLTPEEVATLAAEEWIFLCSDCHCPGDSPEDE